MSNALKNEKAGKPAKITRLSLVRPSNRLKRGKSLNRVPNRGLDLHD